MLYYCLLNQINPFRAEVAQLVEHLTENQRVRSSSLRLGTIVGGSSNGRTTDFGSVYRGSNPCPPEQGAVTWLRLYDGGVV